MASAVFEFRVGDIISVPYRHVNIVIAWLEHITSMANAFTTLLQCFYDRRTIEEKPGKKWFCPKVYHTTLEFVLFACIAPMT